MLHGSGLLVLLMMTRSVALAWESIGPPPCDTHCRTKGQGSLPACSAGTVYAALAGLAVHVHAYNRSGIGARAHLPWQGVWTGRS